MQKSALGKEDLFVSRNLGRILITLTYVLTILQDIGNGHYEPLYSGNESASSQPAPQNYGATGN